MRTFLMVGVVRRRNVYRNLAAIIKHVVFVNKKTKYNDEHSKNRLFASLVTKYYHSIGKKMREPYLASLVYSKRKTGKKMREHYFVRKWVNPR